MMKNVNLKIEVEIHPSVIWRLKLFMAIMRFAIWVGGFGGVEFDIPQRSPTPRVAGECPACAGLGFVNDKRGRRGVDCSDCNGSGIRR